MLFRISINFKQVQDIRDAALDRSNSIEAVTCNLYNRPDQQARNGMANESNRSTISDQ